MGCWIRTAGEEGREASPGLVPTPQIGSGAEKENQAGVGFATGAADKLQKSHGTLRDSGSPFAF